MGWFGRTKRMIKLSCCSRCLQSHHGWWELQYVDIVGLLERGKEEIWQLSGKSESKGICFWPKKGVWTVFGRWKLKRMLSSACQGHTKSIKRVFVCSSESSWTTGLRASTWVTAAASAANSVRRRPRCKTGQNSGGNNNYNFLLSSERIVFSRLLHSLLLVTAVIKSLKKKTQKTFLLPQRWLLFALAHLLACYVFILITNAPEGVSLL